MDLAEHFRLIWRRLWLILLLSLIVAGAVYAYSRSRDEVFSSSSTIDVIGTSAQDDSLTQEQVDIITGRFAALATTTAVISDGLARAGLEDELTIDEAREDLTTSTGETPGFLTITAEAPAAAEARDLARGISRALVAEGRESDTKPRIVTPATLPGGPSEPRPLRDAALAFLIALIVNAELVAFVGRRADRPDPARLGAELQALGAPVLAWLPAKGETKLVEGIRELRARVAAALTESGARSLAIVENHSRSDGAGVGAGLAQAFANARADVVLIDANLREPQVAAHLNLAAEPGLADVLHGEAPTEMLQSANPLQNNYRVLAAGGRVNDPPGRLGLGAFRKIIDELPGDPLVIAVTASADRGVDAAVTATQCDLTVIVLDARRIRRKQVTATLARLREARATVLGAVVTRVKPGRIPAVAV